MKGLTGETQGWKRNWLIEEGYLWDWAALAVAILINHLVPVEAIDPAKREYSPTDPTLSYEYHSNTISSTVLYLLVFLFPGVVFLLTSWLLRSPVDGHHALLSLLEAFALGCGWKRWMSLVGRLRPNWLDVLAKNDEGLEKDSRQAYPSGHATYMFLSATVLSLWAMGKLRLFASPSQGLFAKLMLCLAPLCLATFVACTRLYDYKHDFSDVNAGCFIGICCGTSCYFLNYPSLFDPQCSQPKRRRKGNLQSISGELSDA